MRRLLTLIAGCFAIAIASSSNAQVVPDNSLPNNSEVSDELEITGGTAAGSNLFHSFSEFSIRAGETVFFDNDSAIANIISRVTGNSISNINGLLKANGTADLFLINPNGIIFGENAALDIGGSFVSTTADSIQFADGSEFSAVETETPLLTVNIPVGLQYGSSPGDITVQGEGNNLSIDPDIFNVDRSDRPVGLEVENGNTLALLGGDVFLPGGNITAAEGRIVVGSVSGSELVELSSDTLGWNFDFAQVASFQNINLSQAASIEVSGNGGGEALLQGRNITIADGSAILADTLGDGTGKFLQISATENLDLVGVAANNPFPTRLSTDVDLGAAGDGGNLFLNTSGLAIIDGAQVTSGTFGLGNSGNLTVTASEIEVIGVSDDGNFGSGLFAQADVGNTGDGGDLSIEADFLLVDQAGQISTTTFGSGAAGNLTVTASEIEIVGTSSSSESGLFALAEVDSTGDGGDLSIETDFLLVAQGAAISTGTFGSGNSGNLSVTASEIELAGGSEFGASGLLASSIAESSGDSGNLNIETDKLSIIDGAQIQAVTNSVGNAGTITITSQEINLAGTSPISEPSGIFADAFLAEGNSGDIEITTESLEIAEGAQISTSTSGSGDGGDLNIIARDFISLRGTSESGSSGLFATALAGDGAGGSLTISTGFLSVIEGAAISVSNFSSSSESMFPPGTGAAGNLNITADTIDLDRGNITADTFSGDLGNINFQTDLLVLSNGSQITTDAEGTATGGNITIDATEGFLIASPQGNSDITANAEFGDGGNVNIDVLQVFGIEPSADLTPLSDITTSSEFGIDGSVTLKSQDLNPTAGLTTLPNSINPPQLAQGCEAADNSGSFVNVGQGGLNPQPDAALGGNDLLSDVQLPPEWSESSASVTEAQSWIINEQGKIELVAKMPTKSSLYNCQLD